MSLDLITNLSCRPTAEALNAASASIGLHTREQFGLTCTTSSKVTISVFGVNATTGAQK